MGVTRAFQSTQGMEWISLEWLLDHHKTKEQERRRMVADLNLAPGDAILDLGCGPGLWAPLFAEKVKPNGRVVGVDVSPEPGFPFWPPGHQRSYIQPPPLEPFLWFFHPERLQRPRKGPTLLLRVRKSLEVPHFKQFPRHPSVPFPPSPGLVPLRRRTLSGWHRQTLNPPHHASKQAPRQMALGQHQPVVTGMLHQPPARLHEPLLQARQRPVVDPLR